MATDIYSCLSQKPSDLAAAASGLPRGTQTATPAEVSPTGTALRVAEAKGSESSCLHRAPRGGCQQALTLSFFFDGTGNNLAADAATDQLSNVARLFEARVEDNRASGRFSFYIPGVGTYFKDIGDPGGTPAGLGMGDRGQDRLGWAFARFNDVIQTAEARAANPTNKIIGIRISIFGFSRGATLARAFARDLQAKCTSKDKQYYLKVGGHPVEIIFLGIFDTVASVGLPMSRNNTTVFTALDLYTLRNTLQVRAHGAQSGICDLAFGKPGADPAPGPSDGHSAYADGLQIPSIVKRCIHLIAAHEMRNSFPLDTCLHGARYPEGVTEIVFPGVHSDLGGGYQPGEGARSAHQAEMISMVSLRVMHAEAISTGVPFYGLESLPPSVNPSFALDDESAEKYATMLDHWQHYMASVGATGNVGEQVLAHMRQYYRWRFYSIARARQAWEKSLATPQELAVRERQPGFERQRVRLKKSVEAREAELHAAQLAQRRADQRLLAEEQAQMRYGTPVDRHLLHASRDAQERTAVARDAYLSEKAALDTYADDSALLASAALYDQRLMEDAQALAAALKDNSSLKLRPHYRNVLDAYKDEFERGTGLRDEKVIAFFDRYVHDSLSGFARDATLPSDPRVLYVGGDAKMRYANADIARMEQAA
jgi:hypothetical protein